MRVDDASELDRRPGSPDQQLPPPPRSSPPPAPRIARFAIVAMGLGILVAAFVGRGGTDDAPDMVVAGSGVAMASQAQDDVDLVHVDPADGPCTVGVTLREASSGPDVACLNARLAELGHDADTRSNRFDDRTGTALREFQREHGLAVDGVAGPATLTHLHLWPGSSTSLVVEGGQVFTVGDGQVALTFDDGPGQYSGPVLDELAAHDVVATFFVVGDGVAGNEVTLNRILEDGHSLQNHSWNHPKLRDLSWMEMENQLVDTADAVEAATGHRPTCYRPPHGATNANVRTVASKIGLYPEVLWNVDPRDYLPGVTPEELVDASLEIADGRGLIIGLHDGGDDQSSTVAALPDIISALRDRGYEFVTVCD